MIAVCWRLFKEGAWAKKSRTRAEVCSCLGGQGWVFLHVRRNYGPHCPWGWLPAQCFPLPFGTLLPAWYLIWKPLQRASPLCEAGPAPCPSPRKLVGALMPGKSRWISNGGDQCKLGQALARSRLWFGCWLWTGGKGSRRICAALEGSQGDPCSAEELPLLLTVVNCWEGGSANYLLPWRKVAGEELCLRVIHGNSIISWGGAICTMLLVWRHNSLKSGL